MHTFDDGWPDGMTVSAQGDYWVALTAADRIDDVDTWGRLVVEIPLPGGSLPTNLCVGGRRYDELFVTAAHAGRCCASGSRETPSAVGRDQRRESDTEVVQVGLE